MVDGIENNNATSSLQIGSIKIWLSTYFILFYL